ELVEIISGEKIGLPRFSLKWLQILLTGLLFKDNKKMSSKSSLPPELLRVKRDLNLIGAMGRFKVNLMSPKKVQKLLNRSISKLDSIKKIVKIESDSMGDKLRMVILTDYIRRDMFPTKGHEDIPMNKMGIVPIFESIRRQNYNSMKIGILSGSLIVIPESSRRMLIDILKEEELDKEKIDFAPLEHDDSFLEVRGKGVMHNKLIPIITKLFSRGGINILVGTKSLLGEGWDAPSVNTLILASFVGSFMLSNQMRGRAIRIDPEVPDKVSNIWHLVCVETNTPDPGPDFKTITRRLKAFPGVSFKGPEITSGINRFNLPKLPFKKKDINKINEDIKAFAIDREAVKYKWDIAINKNVKYNRVFESVSANKVLLPRGFVFIHTLKYLLWEAILTGVNSYLFISLYVIRGFAFSYPAIIILLISAIIIAFLVILPKALKALILLIKHGSIRSSLNQIAFTVLSSLYYTGHVKTEYKDLNLVIEKSDMPGSVYCFLEGCTTREQSIFLTALQEVLNPIENPRYILKRKTYLFRKLKRIDYHAVPTVIGAKKEYALYFAKKWKNRVSQMDLIYTRNRKGRLELIKARNHSLSAAFRPRSEKISRWR
ncbi:MAG: DEAD/DEAH box helicase family protein, partial [Promethearchaeota archaeon]